MKAKDLQVGDVICDISYGIDKPYIYMVKNISTFWFRRKNPFLIVNIFRHGSCCILMEAKPQWMPQSWVEMALSRRDVGAMRGNEKIFPKEKSGR